MQITRRGFLTLSGAVGGGRLSLNVTFLLTEQKALIYESLLIYVRIVIYQI
jgi:hypothetical protein